MLRTLEHWPACGIKNCQYDGTTDALTSVKGIWVTDMVFRKVFTITGPLAATPPKAVRAAALTVTPTHCYNLRGQRLAQPRPRSGVYVMTGRQALKLLVR